MTDRHDWRELPPLPEADRPDLPEKLSQSILARQAVCPRSAFLYWKHRGGAGSLEMERGSAFHRFAELATLELVEQNEPKMPPDVAKALMQSVIDDPEFVVAPSEVDDLRVAAYHWAEGTVLDPASVLGVETMIELDLGWATLRGKVDLIHQVDDSTVAVRDYKSSKHMPTQAEFEGSWQVPFYAVLIAYGSVEGGLPLGARGQLFDLAQLYPMLDLRDDGTLKDRQVFVTRAELADHRAYVESVARKLRDNFLTGELAAIPGSHCGTCPRKAECPLPPDLRGPGGAIEDAEVAQEAAERWFFTNQEAQELKAAIRAYAKAENCAVPIGSDMELAFKEEVSETWKTGKRIGRPDADAAKEAMLAAIDRAVQFGEEFDYGEYRVARSSSKFGPRKLEPGEVDVGV